MYQLAGTWSQVSVSEEFCNVFVTKLNVVVSASVSGIGRSRAHSWLAHPVEAGPNLSTAKKCFALLYLIHLSPQVCEHAGLQASCVVFFLISLPSFQASVMTPVISNPQIWSRCSMFPSALFLPCLQKLSGFLIFNFDRYFMHNLLNDCHYRVHCILIVLSFSFVLSPL